MGTSQSVQVANAYSQDIWVRVHSDTNETGESGTTSDLSDALAGLQTHSTSTDIDGILSSKNMVNKGFIKIPKQEVTINKFNKVSKISCTIVYLDDGGRVKQLGADFPMDNSSKALIITGTGVLIEAESPCNSWIDILGRDHKCETCQQIKGTCSLCLIETRLEIVGKSITMVKACQLSEALQGMAEIIKKDGYDKKEAQVKEMLTEIENLAEEYRILEAKTGRVVRNVKSYGEHILEAVEEYLDDEDINFFWEEIQCMETVQGSLKEANEKHDSVKSKIMSIQGEAFRKAGQFESKKNDTAKYLETENPGTEAAFGLPVIGQLGGLLVGAGAVAIEAVDRCKSHGVLVQAVAGAAGFVAGGTLGLAGSLVLLPMSPYYLWKYASSVADIKKFGDISNQFGSISDKMGTVEVHLGKISEALWDIESKLNSTIETEKRARKRLAPWKRDKFVFRMRKNADQLIESCDVYLSISSQHKHQPLPVLQGNGNLTK